MKPKTDFGYIMRDLFSGKDNYALDIGRILWALGVVVFLVMTIVSVIFDLSFDYIAWGAGFGTVLAAGGAALRLKETTEPNNKHNDS